MKITIIDDHPMIYNMFSKYFKRVFTDVNVDIISEFENIKEKILSSNADIFIIDIELISEKIRLNGIDIVESVLEKDKSKKMIILSIHDKIEYKLRAKRAGAKAYISKVIDIDELKKVIERVYSGETLHETFNNIAEKDRKELTKTEKKILKLQYRGYDRGEIALRANISSNTVAWHIGNIYKKLNVTSDIMAIRKGIEEGYIEEDLEEGI